MANLKAGRTAIPSFQAGTLDDPRLTAALKTLELTVRRRLDGVLQGDHLGLIPGPGTEAGEARSYQPGDDVRRMDWSVTARTNQAHVRQMVADRELETWLVVDASGSLDFGSGATTKRDLVVAASSAITHLTSGGGNRIGAVIATGDSVVRVPARSGRTHALEMLKTIATTRRTDPTVRGNLYSAIDALRRPQRRHGLAVVVSDFLGPTNWERPLRAIGAHHDVLAIEVLDPRDIDIPEVGEIVLRDVETGMIREVTITPTVRAKFAHAAQLHRRETEQLLRTANAPRLTLSTDGDWIAEIVRFVAARRRGLGAGAAR